MTVPNDPHHHHHHSRHDRYRPGLECCYRACKPRCTLTVAILMVYFAGRLSVMETVWMAVTDPSRFYAQQQSMLDASMKTKTTAATTATTTTTTTGEAIDFLVAGFAKCGTSTLVELLRSLPEVLMPAREVCEPFGITVSDLQSHELLKAIEYEQAVPAGTNTNGTTSIIPTNTRSSTRQIRGIKCPGGIRRWRTIYRLQQYAPQAKWIIGIRHPVEMFQSYYNYRVAEWHQRVDAMRQQQQQQQSTEQSQAPQLPEQAPPRPETLLRMKDEWQGVSTDLTRYEWFLMQLGKTWDVTTTKDLHRYTNQTHKGLKLIPHNGIRIFIYTMEQLSEEYDSPMDLEFRQSLQRFLGLSTPLPNIPRENVQTDEYPESIRICDERFRNLRTMLIGQATITAKWIAEEFMASTDVVVANPHHFRKLLRSWKRDPCSKS